MSLIFTSDIDWAPEEVIKDMLSLFECFNVKCTLFVTHDSEVIKNCNRNLFEIAIHPNFNKKLFENDNKSVYEIINDLLEIYPEAKGVRSHSLTSNTKLLDAFKQCGLQYESNQFLPYNKSIEINKLWNNLYRIPYNWEDDIHFMFNKSFYNDGFDEFKGLRIYDFHPIHVYLNTDCEKTYLKAKPYYQNITELINNKNNSVIGARNLLLKLLKETKNYSNTDMKLNELILNQI